MLNMQISTRGRVHRPDCSQLPPFPKPWTWPDDQGITTYEKVSHLLHHRDPKPQPVDPCLHCLPSSPANHRTEDTR